MEKMNANMPEKVYFRMLQQEKFIELVCKVANEENINEDLIKEVDSLYGRIEELGEGVTTEKVLQEGWLDRNLEIVEKRFAYVVKVVVDSGEGQIDNLKDAFYELGQEEITDYEGKPVKVVYDAIRDMLLDGGRSEEINQIINEEYDELVWSRVKPTTKKYWDDMGIDFESNYLPLRKRFIQGMLEKTDIRFEKLDDTVCQLVRR